LSKELSKKSKSGKAYKTSGENRGKSALSGGMAKIVGGGIRTSVKRADKVKTFLKRRGNNSLLRCNRKLY